MTALRPQDEATIRDAHRKIVEVVEGMDADDSPSESADDERRIERERSRILRAVFDSLGLR